LAITTKWLSSEPFDIEQQEQAGDMKHQHAHANISQFGTMIPGPHMVKSRPTLPWAQSLQSRSKGRSSTR
ncbi:hypothetical protein LTR66_007347, partial [Elasticomyces elasticus]